MKRLNGFTTIELLVVITIIAIGSFVFFTQKANLNEMQRDSQRKTAINAMYYSLEEVFYEQNNYYPTEINSKVLRSVEPSLFTDPTDVKLGEPSSDYRYESKNCTDNKCKSYVLRADLELEADFVKYSRNK